MRPQQQNRRMRGRGGNNNNNNNNRKGPNPLTRSYESNGPDVKIRGTAQQVADKYTTLARDAQSSGDRVMAENYLQHAEHYNRIIAAAQAQFQPQQTMRDNRDDGDDDVDEREDREDRVEQEATGQSGGRPPRQRIDDGSGPQPVIDGVPAEVALKDRRSNGANGAKPHGRGQVKADANGEEQATQAPKEAPKEAEAASGESAEAEAKPAKRTRRPRVKKTDEQTSAAEAALPEDATAQG